MPFSSTGSNFFRGAAQAQPLTNSGNPFATFSNATKIAGSQGNLFDTIQAVRANELERQTKQAAIAKALSDLYTKQQLAPVELAYKQSQVDSAPLAKMLDQAKVADYLSKIDARGQAGGFFYVNEQGDAVPVNNVPMGSKPVPQGATPYAAQTLATTIKDKEDAKASATESILTNAKDMIQTIDQIKQGKDFFGFGGDLPTIPGITGDYDTRVEWESNMNKLLAKKMLDQIMELKNASATGATGFGQLSEKEGDVLKNASTALKKNLSPEVAVKYLDEMRAIYQKILNGGNSTYDSDKEARYQAWKKAQGL